jgi:hypothetical protein
MKKTLMALMGAALLFGCATHPVSNTNQEERTAYIHRTNNTLDKWDKKASDLKGESEKDLKASIQDARVELNNLRNTSVDEWSMHKARVDNSMARIQSRFGLAE